MDQLTPIKQEFVRIIKRLKQQHGISYTEMHRQTGIKHDLFKKASAGQSFAVTDELVDKLKKTFARELKQYPKAQFGGQLTSDGMDLVLSGRVVQDPGLVYEMDEGEPVPIKGDIQSGTHQLLADHPLQAWLKAQLVLYLQQQLGESYTLTVGQQALYLPTGSIRMVHIGVFSRGDFHPLKESVPRVVIEIDSKADLSGIGETIAYFKKKNVQLQSLGVARIIWIFTESKTIWTVSENGQTVSQEWDTDVLVLDNVSLNIQSLLDEFVAR